MGNVLEGKVAIITGAGDGLGLGIARAFAKEGAIVATMGRRYEKVAAMVSEIQAMGGKALAIQGDVGIRSNVNALVEATVKEFGTVDILVNNAMAYNIKALEDTTDEDIDKIMRSAVYGTIYCMQACFPYLKIKGGKIINFGSMAGLYGLKGHGAYSAAKEGIVGLTRTAALEWAQYGIQVNAIAPLAASDAWYNFEKTSPPAEVKAFLDMIPVGYMGDPERHVGRVCVFLASPDSDWITSRTLFVDGGQGATR
ncbi:MAG: SDR family oxidoreductase [Firmicutes bacterium]|nr:SDR family oxidoreductase [Bacillota bacterium]MCL5056718.1 SDR family oxidoreductase [Actinomycetota bacterium]